MSGEQRAERAGTAGDQHGAVRVERGGRAVRRRAARHQERRQARRQDGAGAQCELRFAAGDCLVQCRGGVRAAVQVEQDEALGLLGLGGPDEAPERGVGQVRDVRGRCPVGGGAAHVRPVGGHRAAGHQDQPGGRETVVRRPGGQHGPRPAQGRAHRCGEVARGVARGVRQGQDDRVRHR